MKTILWCIFIPFLLFGCTGPSGEVAFALAGGQSASAEGRDPASLGCDLPAQFLVRSAFKASWAPDNRRIAFGRKNGTIAVMDVRSGVARELVRPGKDPAWSPDGSYIAYVVEPGERYWSEEVWIIPAEGGSPVKVAEGGFPSWSPDGQQVIYHSRKLGKMFAVRIDDALHAPPAVYYENPLSSYPAVSPDGKYIAFGALRQLVIVERETGETVASLPAALERGFLPGWSPDGSQVGFGGLAASRAGLWIYDLRNRGAFRIATHGNCTMPAWSPDGKWLAFDFRDNPNQIWVLKTKDLPKYPFLETRLPRPPPPRNVIPTKTPTRGRFGPSAATPTEQEVLLALLTQHPLLKGSTEYVVQERTSVRSLHPGYSYEWFEDKLRREAVDRDENFREALEDFLEKNSTSARVQLPTHTPVPVHVVPSETLRELHSASDGTGWDKFYRRWPGARGSIVFSRVGLDAKGSVAIVYMGQTEHYLSGQGNIWVLRRRDGSWVLVKEYIDPGWVS